MGTQEIIAKVQKLRALSSSSNLNEATAAAAAAEKLIAQHRLTEAELTAENKISEPLIEATQYLYETGKVVAWKGILAVRLAEHYGVYVYNACDYSSKRKYSRYAMVGRESDIQILQYNFQYLVQEIQRIADFCVQTGQRGTSVERNSFCLGAVDGIMEKLTQQKKEVEAQATSAALVILNSKHSEAEDFLLKQFAQRGKKMRKGSDFHSQTNADAYQQGKAVGGTIQINSGLGSGSSTKLLKA